MTRTVTELEPDLADRMKKSLRVSGVSVNEMAAHLRVDRNSISRWINGQVTPKMSALMVWAARTDVPLVWLTEGRMPGEDWAVVRPEGFEPPAY